MDSSEASIYWYRNGLRCYDNPCLADTCDKSEPLLPLYVIDPDAPFGLRGAGCVRANFFLEPIQQIDAKLRKMNSQMFVIVGSPESLLPQVVVVLDAVDLYYEREAAALIRESDRNVLNAIKEEEGKEERHIRGYDTHALHPMETYLAKCKSGTAPSICGGSTKIFQSMAIPAEVDDGTKIPPLPPNAMEKLEAIFGDKLRKHVTNRNIVLVKDKPPPPSEASKCKIRFRDKIEDVKEVPSIPAKHKASYWMTKKDLDRIEADVQSTIFMWKKARAGKIAFDEANNTMRGLEHMDQEGRRKKDLAVYKQRKNVFEEINRQKLNHGAVIDWNKIRTASEHHSAESVRLAVEMGKHDEIMFRRAWEDNIDMPAPSPDTIDQTKKKKSLVFWRK